MMFGLRLITRKGLEDIELRARSEALADIIDVIKQGEQVVLRPDDIRGQKFEKALTIISDKPVRFSECSFIGNGSSVRVTRGVRFREAKSAVRYLRSISRWIHDAACP